MYVGSEVGGRKREEGGRGRSEVGGRKREEGGRGRRGEENPNTLIVPRRDSLGAGSFEI